MKKRFFALIMTVLMVVMLISPAAAAPAIKLVIDSKTVDPTVDPYLENGNTLVPIRFIAELLGGEAFWSQTKNQGTIQMAGYKVVFTVDSPKFTVNGSIKTLPSPARAVNGSILVPLRAFVEAIGGAADYNSSTNTATIKYFSNMTGTLKMSGSTTVLPIAQAAADKLKAMNPGLSITVDGGGSGAGLTAVKAGTVNIGNSSSVIKDADLALGVVPHAIANDGIAIIVHPSNPVTNLTKEQASKIFLGEIKNWKDVGGEDKPIIVTTRETGSGTRGTIEELLLEKKPIIASASPYGSSALIKQAVAANKYAIGYDSVGWVDGTVKVVSIDGVKASTSTVLTKTYLLSRELYSCTKGAATGISAMFIDYLRTDEAQKIIFDLGYIKLAA